MRFGCSLNLVGRRLYLLYAGGPEVKNAPKIAIPPCGPALPCMSARSLFLSPPQEKGQNNGFIAWDGVILYNLSGAHE